MPSSDLGRRGTGVVSGWGRESFLSVWQASVHRQKTWQAYVTRNRQRKDSRPLATSLAPTPLLAPVLQTPVRKFVVPAFKRNPALAGPY